MRACGAASSHAVFRLALSLDRQSTHSASAHANIHRRVLVTRRLPINASLLKPARGETAELVFEQVENVGAQTTIGAGEAGNQITGE